MLKNNKNISLLLFASIFTIILLAGCTSRPNNIVNTEQLGIMMGTNSNTYKNHSTVKLDNGVVIYKDNTGSHSPSGYSAISFTPVKPIDFGPSNINFAPKKVDPK